MDAGRFRAFYGGRATVSTSQSAFLAARAPPVFVGNRAEIDRQTVCVDSAIGKWLRDRMLHPTSPTTTLLSEISPNSL